MASCCSDFVDDTRFLPYIPPHFQGVIHICAHQGGSAQKCLLSYMSSEELCSRRYIKQSCPPSVTRLHHFLILNLSHGFQKQRKQGYPTKRGTAVNFGPRIPARLHGAVARFTFSPIHLRRRDLPAPARRDFEWQSSDGACTAMVG